MLLYLLFLYQIFKRTCDSLWFCPNVFQRHCFFEQRSGQIKRRSHKHPPSGHNKPVRKLPFLNRSIIALDYIYNQQFRRRICPPSVAVLSKNLSLSNVQRCTFSELPWMAVVPRSNEFAISKLMFNGCQGCQFRTDKDVRSIRQKQVASIYNVHVVN